MFQTHFTLVKNCVKMSKIFPVCLHERYQCSLFKFWLIGMWQKIVNFCIANNAKFKNESACAQYKRRLPDKIWLYGYIRGYTGLGLGFITKYLHTRKMRQAIS